MNLEGQLFCDGGQMTAPQDTPHGQLWGGCVPDRSDVPGKTLPLGVQGHAVVEVLGKTQSSSHLCALPQAIQRHHGQPIARLEGDSSIVEIQSDHGDGAVRVRVDKGPVEDTRLVPTFLEAAAHFVGLDHVVHVAAVWFQTLLHGFGELPMCLLPGFGVGIRHSGQAVCLGPARLARDFQDSKDLVPVRAHEAALACVRLDDAVENTHESSVARLFDELGDAVVVLDGGNECSPV